MKSILLFVISSLFLLNSCMDVNEKIYINENGGGSYQMDMDMQPIMELMSMMGEESNDSLHIAYEEIAKEESEYANMPGLTNAKNTYDRSKALLSFRFNYDQIASLNGAWNKSNALKDDMGGLAPQNSFKQLTKSKKKYKMNINVKELRSGIAETDESELEMLKMFMGDHNYSIEMKFDRPVKSFSGLYLSQGSDEKTVLFSIPFNALLFDLNVDQILLTVKLK